jgi:hypothetical protein
VRPEKHQVFTDSGRTLRLRLRERKEAVSLREEGGSKQRERERYKELDRECVKERREMGDR